MSVKMTKDVCLSWSSHGEVLSNGMWKFFKENYKTDLEVSLSGHYVKVHHLILSIFCPLIKGIESDKFIKGEELVINKNDLDHLVEFMYKGKINVPQDRLPYLLNGAESLGFKALSTVIKKYLAVQNKPSTVKRKTKESAPPVKKVLKNLDFEKSASENVSSEETPKPDGLETEVEDDYYKGKTNYRRTVDSSCFDPTSLQHICKHCKQGFDVFEDYVNHVRQHENPELKYKCPHCSYRTRLRFGLVQHVVARHEVDMHGKKLQRNLKCPNCSYTCFAKFQLQNHQHTTHSAKPFKCDRCPYGTTSRAGLHKHIRLVHLNERPFMCETCGSLFKTFQSFRNHLTIHVGKKRICEICGANLTINSFHAHMKTHSEDRPHPCHLCSFAARKRYNLKVHLKNVHKMSVDQVDVCLNQEPNMEEEVQKQDELHNSILTISDTYSYENIPSTSTILQLT